jgi:hypothetical protein
VPDNFDPEPSLVISNPPSFDSFAALVGRFIVRSVEDLGIRISDVWGVEHFFPEEESWLSWVEDEARHGFSWVGDKLVSTSVPLAV